MPQRNVPENTLRWLKRFSPINWTC